LKSFVVLAYKISPTKIKDHENLFWYELQKGLHVFFWKCWVQFFEIKQRWAPFLPAFSAILLGFSTNQNFWGCVCTYTTGCTVTCMCAVA